MIKKNKIYPVIFCVVLYMFSSIANAKIDYNKDDIDKIEKYFNDITTFVSPFTQVDAASDKSEGVFYLSRPGKLRWEYYPPDPILILAKGSLFTYYDIELDQVSHINIDDNILGILTKDKIVLDGDGVSIIDFKRSDKYIQVTVAVEGKEEEGKLTLIFNNVKIELLGLKVTDAIGKITNVSFNSPVYGKPLDNKLFSMPIDRKKNRRK